MNQQPTVRGQRINSAPSFPERWYRYKGTDRLDPPVELPKITREDFACAAGDCAGTVHAKGLCGAHYRKQRLGVPLDTDRRRGAFDPSFCGTVSGYKRHYQYDVPLCRPCRDAKNTYDRARRAGNTKKEAA